MEVRAVRGEGWVMTLFVLEEGKGNVMSLDCVM